MNSIYFIKCQSGTENDRKLLIRSVVRRAESTGAECTAKDIAEMLTTQPSDEESMGGEEMSGTDDVPLLCGTSKVLQLRNKGSNNGRFFGRRRIKRRDCSCSDG